MLLGRPCLNRLDFFVSPEMRNECPHLHPHCPPDAIPKIPYFSYSYPQGWGGGGKNIMNGKNKNDICHERRGIGGEVRRIFFVFHTNLPPHPHLATFPRRELCEIRVRADFGRCDLGGGRGGRPKRGADGSPGPAKSEFTAYGPDCTGVGTGADLSTIRRVAMGQ
jgi:hypothetical protein